MQGSPWKGEISLNFWVDWGTGLGVVGNRRDLVKGGQKVLGEMTRTGYHFVGEVESYCNGNTMEPMRITPAKAPSNGDTDLELSIFCNLARPQVEELGHQSEHKTLDIQFVLPAECTRTYQNCWS